MHGPSGVPIATSAHEKSGDATSIDGGESAMAAVVFGEGRVEPIVCDPLDGDNNALLDVSRSSEEIISEIKIRECNVRLERCDHLMEIWDPEDDDPLTRRSGRTG